MLALLCKLYLPSGFECCHLFCHCFANGPSADACLTTGKESSPGASLSQGLILGTKCPIGLGQLGQVNRPAACLQWGLVPCCNMAHCLRAELEGEGFIQEMDQGMGL